MAMEESLSKDDSHEFGFPFPPYDIQIELMNAAYNTYDKEMFALLESPTGTGKSLSLICSALSWLRNHKAFVMEQMQARKEALSARIEKLKEEEDQGDWLSVQGKRQEVTRELESVCKKLEHLVRFDQRSEARRHAKLHSIPLENYSALTADVSILNKTIDNTMNESLDASSLITNSGNLSRSMLGEANNGEDEVEDLEKSIKAKEDQDQVKPKIFYASRTHSQLSQFVNEIKKTRFADIDAGIPIKVTALASRANLCVNPEVLKLRDPSAINERCMEMQRETKPENRCPYIKSSQMNALKEDILTTVYDIEDLVSRGRVQGSCPYYAARLAIPEAELVVLPYNNLLHRETRLASALDLKENIVIVDEAHNILETICSIHSAPLNGHQLVGSHTILSRYYQKYHKRMSPRNAAMVKTIVQCLTALIKYLKEPNQHLKNYDCPKAINPDQDENHGNIDSKKTPDPKYTLNSKDKQESAPLRHEEFMIDVNRFIGAANIERFNVFKIIDYFSRSQLARKLLGSYKQDPSIDLDLEIHGLDVEINETDSPKKKKPRVNSKAKSTTEPAQVHGEKWEWTNLKFIRDSVATRKAQKGPKRKSMASDPLINPSYPIYTLIEFLRSLTNLSDDGKILTEFKQNDIFNSSLKFILLNPSSQFKQMVSEARSIVLAGGTMQPFQEFKDLLFGPLGVDETRLKLFSCGHIIDKDHLHVASLVTGPSGKELELSYRVKNSMNNIDEIGITIFQIANVAPAGMVCFLPSYEYEQFCYTRWTQTGIISKIETRSKQVFREPRQANHLKPVLDEYSRVIEKGKTTGRGALLFCVVGGKMSEGINFNDDLGRCVVMIGLPYANIKSGELQQKMVYYDRTCKPSGKGAPSAGKQYYENLCLKGINQSIGRAIRHKNDYAAIILLDRRYTTKDNIKLGLPHWMRQSMNEYPRFGPMLSSLKVFYEKLKGNNAKPC